MSSYHNGHLAIEGASHVSALRPVYSSCVDYLRSFKRALPSSDEGGDGDGGGGSRDIDALLLKLDLELECMLIWGEKHGVLKMKDEGRSPSLDRPAPCQKVLRTLKVIKALFEKEQSRKKYGIEVLDSASGRLGIDGDDALAKTFPSTSALARIGHLKARFEGEEDALGHRNEAQYVSWAIVDADLFEDMIKDVHEQVLALYSVLPVRNIDRDRLAMQDIRSLRPNLSRLRIIETVTQELYPAWSDATTLLIEVSETESVLRGPSTIDRWMNKVATPSVMEKLTNTSAIIEFATPSLRTPVKPTAATGGAAAANAVELPPEGITSPPPGAIPPPLCPFKTSVDSNMTTYSDQPRLQPQIRAPLQGC
jgi:hypothetical protein